MNLRYYGRTSMKINACVCDLSDFFVCAYHIYIFNCFDCAMERKICLSCTGDLPVIYEDGYGEQ